MPVLPACRLLAKARSTLQRAEPKRCRWEAQRLLHLRWPDSHRALVLRLHQPATGHRASGRRGRRITRMSAITSRVSARLPHGLAWRHRGGRRPGSSDGKTGRGPWSWFSSTRASRSSSRSIVCVRMGRAILARHTEALQPGGPPGCKAKRRGQLLPRRAQW